MVHNGIEYGMLQAYGEGFEILQASQFDIDLRAIAYLWNQAFVPGSLNLRKMPFRKIVSSILSKAT